MWCGLLSATFKSVGAQCAVSRGGGGVLRLSSLGSARVRLPQRGGRPRPSPCSILLLQTTCESKLLQACIYHYLSGFSLAFSPGASSCLYWLARFRRPRSLWCCCAKVSVLALFPCSFAVGSFAAIKDSRRFLSVLPELRCLLPSLFHLSPPPLKATGGRKAYGVRSTPTLFE